MDFEEKQIKTRRIFEGDIINLRKDEVLLLNGKTAEREVVEHNGGVCVAAVDDEDNILLVRQFRYPQNKEIYEVPAGKLAKGENPESCGIRELREETGAVAKNFESLGFVYPSPGYSNEILYMYLATGLSFGRQNLDPDEFLEAIKMPIKEAINLSLNGEISDAKTISIIFRTALKLGYLKY